jgi:glyoxylase I family protein
MTTIGGINHFAIKVRDLVAAERFYRDVLGLTVLRRWPAATGGGDRSVWLDTGDGVGTFLALESVGGDDATAESHRNSRGTSDSRDGSASRDGSENAGGRSAVDHPGHHLLALRIRRDQRATWEAKLAASRVVVSHRTAYTIYFTDPEGNRLGLSHYPERQE